MLTFIFSVEDGKGDSLSIVRSASSWLTAWEVVSRKLRRSQMGKVEPVAFEWFTETITVYDAQFQVITRGSRSDLDKKLCFDATGKTEVKFGV